jgi:hypothetical protein
LQQHDPNGPEFTDVQSNGQQSQEEAEYEYQRYIEHQEQQQQRQYNGQQQQASPSRALPGGVQAQGPSYPSQFTGHHQQRLSALDRQKSIGVALQRHAHLLPVAGSPSHVRRTGEAAVIPDKNTSSQDILTHQGQTAEEAWYASHTNSVFDIKHPGYLGPSEPAPEMFRSETENSANYKAPTAAAGSKYGGPVDEWMQRQQTSLQHKLRAEAHQTPNRYNPGSHHHSSPSQESFRPIQSQLSPTKFPALNSPQR